MVEFLLLHSQAVPLTPELASEFRDLPASRTERPLDQGRVRMLKEKLDAGLFIPVQWSKAIFEGETIRMNGQHSSHVLCEANGNFPTGLYAHIDTYDVTSKDGLAQLFGQFDARKSGRTISDVSGAYQLLHDELADIPRDVAKLAIDGVTWFRRHIEGVPTPSGDGVYTLFRETGLHSFIQWLGELLTIKTPELKRAPVVAAMYSTFVKNEEVSRKFWDEVARGGNFDEFAPTTVLDSWLKSTKESGPTKNMLKPGNFYNGSVHAWNVYRAGKTIKAIQHDTKKGFHDPQN